MTDTLIVDEALADEMAAALGDGYEEAQAPYPEITAPRADAPAPVLHPAADPAVGSLPAQAEEHIVLVNLRFINETVFIPNGTEFTGDQVRFTDGHLILTDRERADAIKAICPYVYEEPKTGPIFGPHTVTGFQTRNPDAWSEYNIQYSLNS